MAELGITAGALQHPFAFSPESRHRCSTLILFLASPLPLQYPHCGRQTPMCYGHRKTDRNSLRAVPLSCEVRSPALEPGKALMTHITGNTQRRSPLVFELLCPPLFVLVGLLAVWLVKPRACTTRQVLCHRANLSPQPNLMFLTLIRTQLLLLEEAQKLHRQPRVDQGSEQRFLSVEPQPRDSSSQHGPICSFYERKKWRMTRCIAQLMKHLPALHS